MSETSGESLQDIERSLKDNFKLSSYEARVYLSLARLGKQKLKQLSQTAGVPLPRIYDTLESLMSKGFIMKQEESFAPIPVKQALMGRVAQFEMQFQEEQKHRIEVEQDLVSAFQLASFSPAVSGNSSSEISILKGFNTIANKFAELLENSRDVYLVAKRAVEAKEFFIPILAGLSSGATERRIRIITPKTTKITKKEWENAQEIGIEIRKSNNIIFDIMVADTDDVLLGVPDPLSEEINHAIGIWVHNRSFAGSTRTAIEEMWKLAEKV